MSSFVPLSRSQLRFIADEFWPGGGENDDGRDLYGVAKHEGVWREETLDADLIAEALHPSDADYYEREGVADMDDEEFERWLAEDDADEDAAISVDGQPLDEFLADYGDELDDQGPAFDDGRFLSESKEDPYSDLDGEDGPDSLELAMSELQAEYREAQRPRWDELDLVSNGSEFDGLVSSCTPEASRNLERFERDGVRKQSASAANAGGFRTKDWRRREWPNIGPHWVYNPMTGSSGPNPRWNGRQRFDSWKRHRRAQFRLRQISPLVTDPRYRAAA